MHCDAIQSCQLRLGTGMLWMNILTAAGQSGLDVNAAGYTYRL